MSAPTRLFKTSPLAREAQEPLAEDFESSKTALALAGIGIWRLHIPSGELNDNRPEAGRIMRRG